MDREDAKKRGSGDEEDGRTGRRTWRGYEKRERRFVLAGQLNGQRHLLEQHGEKILACCYISPVVMKLVHMKK